jgi:hypothetical protein
MEFSTPVRALIVGVSLIPAYFISKWLMKKWPTKGKWGLPKGPVNCSIFGSSPLLFRKPANSRQMIWGGWPCSKCGNELDKYGVPVTAEPSDAKS